jgi:acyl-CoA thioesterase I
MPGIAVNAIIIVFFRYALLSPAAGTIAYNRSDRRYNCRCSIVRRCGPFHKGGASERSTSVNRQNLCKPIFILAAAAAISVPLLIAQQPAVSPGTEAPAAEQAAPKVTHPPQYYVWKKAHDAQLLVDFGGLDHFRQADAMLAPPKPGEERVVFMGDSITQDWKLDDSFPGKSYINRGISGQTSPQMLVRFRQDVIDLKPKVVLIMTGTNDIMENTGPMTVEQSGESIASMADLATANGIQVVLCSVLPSFTFGWSPGLEPAPKIAELNAWIKLYAAEKGYVYVDYYSAMKDERGGLPPALSEDGVHPLPAGYAIMAPLAQAGIEKALKR